MCVFSRKPIINKEYLDLCRTTQKYPAVAISQVRYFFYGNYIKDLYRHLGWYINFASKYGLKINVKG